MKLIKLATCVVDADNNFRLGNLILKISPKLKEYKVYNHYSVSEDFTNISEMSEVTVKIDAEVSGKIMFFDENEKEITKEISLVTEVE